MDGSMFAMKIENVLMQGLSFRLDGFRLVYAAVCTFMWICSAMLSKQYFSKSFEMKRYRFFCILTYIATMGVFLSGDMYTTFCFFEVMSIASYAMVAHTEKEDALKAAGVYLAVAVIGGLVMLMGIFMLYTITGTLDYMKLYEAVVRAKEASMVNEKKLYIAGLLILFGFGAKAGMYPLHIWLPKAHPVAPAPASALLSGILTKSGLFGVLILCMEVFRNDDLFGMIIYFLGLLTMFTGAVLAVFSIDLKRTLACSSVSQIGFILTGIGLIPLLKEEAALASTGSVLYMFNHSMFKLCLFLAAGAVYIVGHKLNLNEIRGIGRNMHVVKILFLIGALGISGVPMFSGYVSKTLIHEAIVEYSNEAQVLGPVFKASEWLFLLSGGMTAAYMTKLFVAVFIEKPAQNQHREAKPGFLSTLSIALPALIIVFMGVFPKFFIEKIGGLLTSFNNYSLSQENIEVLEGLQMFSLENLKGSLISLSIGAVIYILIRCFLTEKDSEKNTVYLDKWPAKLDIEEGFYRPLIMKWLPGLFGFIFDALNMTVNAVSKAVFVAAGKVAEVVSASMRVVFDLLSGSIFSELKAKKHPLLKRMKKILVKYEGKEKEYASTVSLSVLLISLGLCFTLFYLLYLLF